MKLKTKKKGGNLHCIMAFQRNKYQGLSRRDLALCRPSPSVKVNADPQRAIHFDDVSSCGDTSSCAGSELDMQEIMCESDSD